jgi:heme/copper-type cytochrome/quinol oxidase subunit 4
MQMIKFLTYLTLTLIALDVLMTGMAYGTDKIPMGITFVGIAIAVRLMYNWFDVQLV